MERMPYTPSDRKVPLYQIFSLDQRSVGTVFFWPSRAGKMARKASAREVRMDVDIFMNADGHTVDAVGKLSPHDG